MGGLRNIEPVELELPFILAGGRVRNGGGEGVSGGEGRSMTLPSILTPT